MNRFQFFKKGNWGKFRTAIINSEPYFVHLGTAEVLGNEETVYMLRAYCNNDKQLFNADKRTEILLKCHFESEQNGITIICIDGTAYFTKMPETMMKGQALFKNKYLYDLKS